MGSLYLPNSPNIDLKQFIELLGKLCEMNIQFAIFGDLNCWHKSWNCHKNNKRDILLYDAILKNNCHIFHSSDATRYASGNAKHDTWLDLMITNKKYICRDIHHSLPIDDLKSDHEGIIAVIKTPIQRKKIITNEMIKYHFEKTTIEEYKNYRKCINTSKLNIITVGNKHICELQLNEIKRIIITASKKHIPKKRKK